MKIRNTVTTIVLLAALGASATGMLAQTQDSEAQKTRQRLTTVPQDKSKSKTKTQKPLNQQGASGDRLEPDETNRTPADVPNETVANRQEQMSEEAAIEPFYNNFFSTYRLGPEDVISVNVFGQERYSRNGITIPPSGRISLALIPGGVFVNGKTVYQVADLITKAYDEYIIDPQVSVSLEKANSYRYGIIGDVAQPGIRLMTHRMTVTEAIAEAGGFLPTSNQSKVVVLRRQNNGMLAKIPVNVSHIYRGLEADSTYLVPGDQIMVPGNTLKKVQQIMGLTSILTFARIFAGGGF